MQNNENKLLFTFGWTKIFTLNTKRNECACLNNAWNISWFKSVKYSVLKGYKSEFHFTRSVRSEKGTLMEGNQVRHLLRLSRNGGDKSRLSDFHQNCNRTFYLRKIFVE